MMNKSLIEAYIAIKAYMDMLDVDIQTAWLYLEEGYNKFAELTKTQENMATIATIRTRIYTLLDKKGMSVYRLAKEAEMYQCDLYNALSGKRPFYSAWRKRIAEALEVTEAELFREGAEE